jgi:hypothetical protein
MAATFHFGDLVVTREDAVPGLIAELRRDDCRVQYLREGRSVWIGLRALRHARPEDSAGGPEPMVRDILELLKAVEMEFAMLDGARCRLDASHGAIDPGIVDRVRAMLGERLIAYVIRPQGMHRILSSLEFRL